MRLRRFALATLALALLAAPGGHAVRVEHRAADQAPTLGPADAPVTVELFFSPGQPTMHDAYRVVVQLQRRHPTRVRAIFRPLPRNQNAPHISLAAHKRGKFFDLMTALVTGPSTPSAPQTIALAVKLGLGRAAVERAHLDDAILATLEANRDRQSRLGIPNPEIVFNGEPIGGRVPANAADISNLEREYQAAYEDARRAESQGFTNDDLLRWGSQRTACGDRDEDDAEDEKAQPLVTTLVEPPAEEAVAGRLFDLPAVKKEDVAPPRFAWRLGRLLFRGTGCRAGTHMPRPLDGQTLGPAQSDPAPLLAAPMPSAGLPSFGASDAPVPIFVVCNLRGRFCHDQLDLARRLAEHHAGDVRVIWVPWIDLTGDGAARDLTLAQAALCANRDGDGFGFVRAVTTAGIPTRRRLDLAALSAAAGLDIDSIVTCANGDPAQARAAVEAARAAGIGYSPTVVIGGRAYVGGFNDDGPAAQHIAAELAPGLLETLVPSASVR